MVKDLDALLLKDIPCYFVIILKEDVVTSTSILGNEGNAYDDEIIFMPTK